MKIRMHRAARVALLAALLPTTAACGLIKIETKGAFSGGGSSGGGSAGDSGAQDAAGLEKSVAATYATWSFESCKNFECINAFQKEAGVKTWTDAGTYVFKYNPRNGKNPDPTWLPGWDKLTTDEHANQADEVYQALILAASHKTWIERCHADYDKIDPGLRETDKKLIAEIDRAKAIKDPYAKIAALLALRGSVPKGDKDGVVKRLTETVGARVQLEAAIQDAFKETGREYLYWIQGFRPDESFLREYRPRHSKEEERDLYCSYAMRGTDLTPENTQMGSNYLEKGAVAVKPLFTKEELEKLDREKWAKEGKDRYSTKDRWDAPWLTDAIDGKSSIPGMPKVGRFGGIPIKKITKGADGVVLELFETYDNEYAYDCVDTNRISGVDSNGQFIYKSICKTGKATTEKSATLKVKELPEGLDLKAGDTLDVFVRGDKHEKKELAKSKAFEKTHESWEGEIIHVERVTRDKKVIGAWFKK